MTVEELKIVISAQVQGLRSNLADAKARLRGVASEADNTKASIDSMSDANLAGLKQQFNDAKAKVSELTNKIKEADAELKKLTKEYNSYFVNVSPASRTGFENALGNNAEFQKLKENIESVKTNLAA